MTSVREYLPLAFVAAFALLLVGCEGTLDQSDMRKYARKGKAEQVDEDQALPNAADSNSRVQVAQVGPKKTDPSKESEKQKQPASAQTQESTDSPTDSANPAATSENSRDERQAPNTAKAAATTTYARKVGDDEDEEDDKRNPNRLTPPTTARKVGDDEDEDIPPPKKPERAVAQSDDEGENKTGRFIAAPIVKAEAPAKQVLEKTSTELGEIYQSSWDRAKTAAERTEFANELLDKGKVMRDMNVKYALLLTAMRIASHAAEPHVAIQCIDELNKAFDVDVHKLKMQVVETVRTIKSDDQRKSKGFLDKLAAELYDEAFQRDEFEDATMLFAIRQAAARNDGDNVQLQRIGIDKRQLELAKSEYKRMKRSLDALSEVGDLEANTVAGKYYCFVKQNWTRGLMMLSQGPADGELSKIAREEISGATDSNGWILIANRWWSYGEEDEENQLSIRLHAVYIYERALPKATDGVEKLRAEVRVKQARKILGDQVVDDLDPRYQRSYAALNAN